MCKVWGLYRGSIFQFFFFLVCFARAIFQHHFWDNIFSQLNGFETLSKSIHASVGQLLNCLKFHSSMATPPPTLYCLYYSRQYNMQSVCIYACVCSVKKFNVKLYQVNWGRYSSGPDPSGMNFCITCQSHSHDQLKCFLGAKGIRLDVGRRELLILVITNENLKKQRL